MVKRAFATFLAFSLFLAYAYLFYKKMERFYFHPGWTTDDALQQTFPFWEAVYPDLFKGDLIADVMKGTNGPIHLRLGLFITEFTKNPVMTAHIIMTIQLGITLLALFLAVRAVSSSAAGFFAVAWFLHTRTVVQRITGGLARGWFPPVIAVFLYLFFTKRYNWILFYLAIACLLHPPGALVCAVSYGLYLLYLFLARRAEGKRELLKFTVLSPVYLLAVYSFVHRPPEVGQMVGPKQAASMPEFYVPKGRFPYLPLAPISVEIKTFAFEAFNSRLYRPSKAVKGSSGKKGGDLKALTADMLFEASKFIKRHGRQLAALFVSLIFLIAVRKGREPFPRQLYFFLCSVAAVYLVSRQVVFKLYIPFYYLHIPIAFFCIIFFSVSIWRLFADDRGKGEIRLASFILSYGALALFICGGSGLMPRGDMNLNYSSTKDGGVFLWIRKNTPLNSLIAGDPTLLNGVMLFGVRRGFATTETYHPFYPRYAAEIRRRIKLSFQAHFASSLEEIVEVLKPEGIDYFLFDRKKFHPKAIRKVSYYAPLDKFVESLVRKDLNRFAYTKIIKDLKAGRAPYAVYYDRRSLLIDLHKLESYLKSRSSEFELGGVS